MKWFDYAAPRTLSEALALLGANPGARLLAGGTDLLVQMRAGVLKPGVIGRIKSCQKDAEWCQVQVAGHSGYLRRMQFWGTLTGEQIPSP